MRQCPFKGRPTLLIDPTQLGKGQEFCKGLRMLSPSDRRELGSCRNGPYWGSLRAKPRVGRGAALFGWFGLKSSSAPSSPGSGSVRLARHLPWWRMRTGDQPQALRGTWG